MTAAASSVSFRTPCSALRFAAVLAVAALLAAACGSDGNDAAQPPPVDPTQVSAPDAAVGSDSDAGSDRDTDPGTHSGSDRDTDPGTHAGADSGDGASPTTAPAESPNAQGSGSDSTGTRGTDGGEDGDGAAVLGLIDGVAVQAERAGLTSFDDCNGLLGYVTEHASFAQLDRHRDLRVGPLGGMADSTDAESDVALGLGSPQAFGVDEAQARSSLVPGVDYSGTNVQEAGIDEPDIAKTDGRRLLYAFQSTERNSTERFVVADITGATPQIRSEVWISDADDSETSTIDAMLLHGDRLLVVASSWSSLVPPIQDGVDGTGGNGAEEDLLRIDPAVTPFGWGPRTDLLEYDLTDDRSPSLTGRLRLDGRFVDARMIGGVARIVSVSQPPLDSWMPPFALDDLAGDPENGDDGDDVVVPFAAEDWLPHYRLRDRTGETAAAGPLVDCADVRYPSTYAGLGMLSVTTVNLSSDGSGLSGPPDTVSVLGDAPTVYASADSLYVSTQRWADWDALTPRLPDETESEWQQRLNDTQLTTQIHQFDISDASASRYVGSASVPGSVLNQYSMSEHNDVLRVATTTWNGWWGDEQSESMVTMLRPGTEQLEQLGQIRGLGRGERIYAVRYLGDIAAVVTFRETDPLYTLDLSDPAAPRLRGELKITGYSAYLHPLGGDLLLGVGQDADLQGRTLGTQVSLFDISDLDRPQRVDQWTMPSGRSQVEFNPRAFLYWAPERLVVVPLIEDRWDGWDASVSDPADVEVPFQGAVVLGVDGSGAQARLQERSRRTHADESRRECTESRTLTYDRDGEISGPVERWCWYGIDWAASITRSAVVGDSLYTMSDLALEKTDLATLGPGTRLEWGE